MGIDAEMYIITSKKLTDDQIRSLSFRAGETFGAGKFYRPKGEHNISRVKGDVIEQDGPDLPIPPGSHALRVNLCTRYYGVGYERGDLPFLIMLAAWLEEVVGECSIYYGGDSSGVLAEPFDARARAKLFKHFCSPIGRAYFVRPGGPPCRLCQVNMNDMGGGPGVMFWECNGCGGKLITYTDGRPPKKLEFHEDFLKET